jgi:O-antigen biosynthesis protein
MTEPPFVSIVIVNYNGAHYLPTCLESLEQQNYPRDHFETIVSDNGSVDSSIKLLEEKYPWVKIIQNKKNLGFSKGNNRAIKQAQGEMLVLLNNDTAPEPGWLSQLVSTALNYPDAGIITGHLLLFYDELDVQLETTLAQSSGGSHNPGIRIYAVESGTPRGVPQYLEGFYGWEVDRNGQRYRRCQDKAVLGIPVPLKTGDVNVMLSLSGHQMTEPQVTLNIKIGSRVLTKFKISKSGQDKYEFILPENERHLAVPIEQNTGSIIFTNGMGRDRGTFSKNNEVFYEKEHGQYSHIEEVFAGCGASLLIRRAVIKEIGFLDESFFMYYEDTDLCWRARLRGWSVLYSPGARIRHIHCGTTTEWSPFFQYLTERNRLAMVFKNGAKLQVIRTWGGFIIKSFRNGLDMLSKIIQRQIDWRRNAKMMLIDAHVLITLFWWLPRLIFQRINIQTTKKVSQTLLEKWFLEP